jgi:hypothetical protein
VEKLSKMILEKRVSLGTLEKLAKDESTSLMKIYQNYNLKIIFLFDEYK